MSLPFMPNVTEFTLQQFEATGYSDADALSLASGMIMEAIPCLETLYPTLPAYDQKLADYAVLEMAKFVKINYFNFERATSPFSSETIGSYSYNKILSEASKSGAVPGFERAVARLGGLCLEEAGVNVATSEQVFKPGYDNYRATREGRLTRDMWWS